MSTCSGGFAKLQSCNHPTSWKFIQALKVEQAKSDVFVKQSLAVSIRLLCLDSTIPLPFCHCHFDVLLFHCAVVMFHCTVVVNFFCSIDTVAVALENGIAGNVFL